MAKLCGDPVHFAHSDLGPIVDPGRPPSVGTGGGPSSTNGGGRMDPGVLGMAVQHSPAANHLGMTAWYVLASTKDPWH